MFLLAIVLQTATASEAVGRTIPLNDGLPTYTYDQAEDLREKWRRCLIDQADGATKYTDDPSNVIVDVAVELCSTKMSDAQFAWRRYIIVASTYNLNDQRAAAMAEEFFSESLASQRKYLLGRVSLNKQIQAIDRLDAAEKERRR